MSKEIEGTPKILFSTYPTSFQIFGGAEIQLLKTKNSLEKLSNCKITLFDMFRHRLDEFDILHNFKMHPDNLSLFQMAKQAGVKCALSSIYWHDPPGVTHYFGPSALARLYLNVKKYHFLTFRQLTPFKEYLDLADIILPNAIIEAELLSSTFKISREKFWVVPNGVNEKFASAEPDFFEKKYGLTNFVLFVGRIDRRKNVLNLIESCKDLGLPLVIIGHPEESEYFEQCQKAVSTCTNIKLLGFLPHDSQDLRSAYAAAKVLALPSNFETPGLVALEAGLAGCNIVITSQGSTKEYFREHAFYVNPNSITDLKKQLKIAFEQPKSSELKKIILENYTWDKVAEETLRAYRQII